MKKLITFIGLALLLSLCATPVYAIPALPHAFYGSVTINGSPAPIGTSVEARGTGVRTGIEGNPITVAETGKYGGPDGLDPKLVVQGELLLEEATITFYVNGVSTGETYPFDSGETNKLDLYATIAAPEGPPALGAPTALYLETNLFGTSTDFRISETGEILKTIEATSAEGNLTLYLPKGTIALDKNGKPLESLEAGVDESPTDPPVNAHIIGLPYIFEPSGATFAPPITFIWSYDPDALPEGVAEEDLVIAYYDEDAGKWVALDGVVDTENNTITASVAHFTTIAILSMPPAAFTSSSLVISPAEVAPGEKVNISISVANTGSREGRYTVVLKINGVEEAEKRVTIAAGGSQEVSFTVAKEEAGSYTVAVDGLSGSFAVAAPLPPVVPAPVTPPPVVPAPVPPPPVPAPVPPPPVPVPAPAPAPMPAPMPALYWYLIGASAVVLIVAIVLLWVKRRHD